MVMPNDRVFDHTPIPMLVLDPYADRIIDANPAACRLLGHSRAQLRAMAATDLHPGQRAALVVFTQAVMDRDGWWTHDLAPRHADGRSLEVEYAGGILPDPDGTPRLLVVISDLVAARQREIHREAVMHMRGGIAEWQRAERVFRNIERDNQLILRAAGEGIYGVNAEGLTTFVNPAAERMLGWAAEDLVGQDMHALVHHTDRCGQPYPHEKCPIYAAFRDGVVHHVDDEVFWRRDGSAIAVEYTSTPIRDRGHLVGAVIVFRDISQRREAAEKLKRALEEVESLRQRLELENAYLQEEIRQEHAQHGILGRSPAIRQLLTQIDLVAPTEATVLITGESGTGKELIARAIHDASTRRDRPLIRVNCATIPRELFESEMFGHVRGAFTGAVRDRVGRFELADGGTLFLDEVGEIPLELQSKLLRVLQEAEFERVGEERTRRADVRVIAATNRDLRAEVRSRRFREDLYYRLNVFPIESRPLRERQDDIPLLAAHFLATAARRMKLGDLRLTEGDVRRLRAYDWPGNVRELENLMERAAILARNGRPRFELPVGTPAAQAGGAAGPDRAAVMTDAERRERDRASIVAALEACGGKVFGAGGAAELLGVKPTTLASRIRKLGLSDTRAMVSRGR
ncbi:MAG: sigma 54-interacting transcriptional regulator [Acetobacteraceae bacterium]